MRYLATAVLALLLAAGGAHAAGGGMVSLESAHDVPTATDRLVDALEAKGMTVFRAIDPARGATGAGIELRPTRLVVFGRAGGDVEVAGAAPTPTPQRERG